MPIGSENGPCGLSCSQPAPCYLRHEMHFITDLPIWALALLIFCLRIGDVSIGTMRTIAVVNGRVKLSVLLGFFEVIIWILAIGSVIQRIAEHPILPILMHPQ